VIFWRWPFIWVGGGFAREYDEADRRLVDYATLIGWGRITEKV